MKTPMKSMTIIYDELGDTILMKKTTWKRIVRFMQERGIKVSKPEPVAPKKTK